MRLIIYFRIPILYINIIYPKINCFIQTVRIIDIIILVSIKHMPVFYKMFKLRPIQVD